MLTKNLRCFILVFWPFIVWADKNSSWVGRILNETTRNYDNKIIPVQSGKPLELELRVYLLNLADLRPTHSHFSTEVILHTSWVDERLKFDRNQSAPYRLSGDAIELLWTPDILIDSQKAGKQSHVTRRNIFGVISPSGKIITSQRFLVENYCVMNFFFFPFDEQICEVRLMSYAYSIEWLSMKWIVENPILTWDETKVSGKFHLTGFETSRMLDDYQSFGIYEVLVLKMKLRRRDTALALRIYVPLTVMVVMSWLCFLIDYRSVPARTSMNAALVLTVITFIASIQQQLPMTSTSRVVDIHMLVCFLFIFAGLVEYSFVRSIVIQSYSTHNKKHLKGIKSGLNKTSTDQKIDSAAAGRWKAMRNRLGEGGEEVVEKPKIRRFSLTHKLQKMYLKDDNDYHILDRISMICFPITYIVYCVCYYVYVKYGQ